MSGNDDVKVNIWTGEDLNGSFNTQVALPNGGSIFTKLSGIIIKTGDCVNLNFGRSMGNQQ